MPELPEAETIVRTLRPHVGGQRILEARFLAQRVRPAPIPDLAERTVRGVERYGKQVVIELDRGFLVVQLRMTGLLLWRETSGPHTRAVLRFPRGVVCFDDIRQFGSIRWRDEFPNELGPDPLEIGADELAGLLAGRARKLKPLLLDQDFLRGLGNICVDEILYRAGIHPRARADRLGTRRASRLHAVMRETLEEAIALGGSSISDYLDADGRRGSFQLRHKVYGKAGQPCQGCGEAIRRIVVGQRGTHYCPRCQRR